MSVFQTLASEPLAFQIIGMTENAIIKALVITISDSRRENDDVSGATLVKLLGEIGAKSEKIIITDDTEKIVATLKFNAMRDDINLILTTGGTGLAPRDNTPEATLKVIEKEVPGISEAMRFGTLNKTPQAMLSRGVSGILQNTLIINLPGSTKAVRECFEIIKPVLQHSVNLLSNKTGH